MRFIICVYLLFFTNSAFAENKEFTKEQIRYSRNTFNKIAGVYKYRFRNEVYNGTTFVKEKSYVENIIEIVPVSDIAAYIKFRLYFTNFHLCLMEGIFQFKENDIYQYVASNEEDKCKMKMIILKDEIIFEDHDYGCKYQSCGARGYYDGYKIPIKEIKAIKYMKRLKNSPEFKKSLADYDKTLD